MKQILILILTLPLFIGCSDDKEAKEDDFELTSLVGTVWEGESSGYTRRLVFIDEEICNFYSDIKDTPDRYWEYTYAFENSNVYLTPNGNASSDLECTI